MEELIPDFPADYDKLAVSAVVGGENGRLAFDLRRQAIVKAASEVFASSAVAASIRTIADRVGASPATLMQCFGSKEGLLAAVRAVPDHDCGGI